MSITATESQEQTAFVSWFRLQYPGVLIFSVPNGCHLAGTGPRRAMQMARLKAEGLTSGIPDLCIPEWGPLWVEMKRAKGGRLSDDQATVHGYLRAIGQTVIVAAGWDAAADAVRSFRRGEPGDTWQSIGSLASKIVGDQK